MLNVFSETYRSIGRAREIVSTLSKYGLADWLSQFQLGFASNILKSEKGEVLSKYSREERIRMALVDLGPTFIKLGQLLSTRADVIGIDLAKELEDLQANVPADDGKSVKELIERELGQPIEALFDEFNAKAIASGSIGQVHSAKLKDGSDVVIKVRHIDIEDVIHEDLDILARLAELAEKVTALQNYRPASLVAEFQRTLRREIDFGREERSLQEFGNLFEDNDKVKIPEVFPDLSTSKVLTMECITGTKLRDVTEAIGDREKLAERGADLFLEMIFIHGVYHADPHPGNILILPNGVIGLIDFGMTGRLEDKLKEQIEELLLAIMNNDAQEMASIIIRLGSTPDDLDETGLRRDLDEFVSYYGATPLDQLDVTAALGDVVKIIRRHGIFLPAQVGMLIKVLVSLEGSSRLLNPNFSLIQVLQPFSNRLLRHRFSPGRQIKKLRRFYNEMARFIEILPHRVLDIVEKIDTDRFDVNLNHRGMEPSVNRLVLGILTSALFLGSSLLLSAKVPPLLFPYEAWYGLEKLSLFGLFGMVLSVLSALRLIWAIRKSGQLENHGLPRRRNR